MNPQYMQHHQQQQPQPPYYGGPPTGPPYPGPNSNAPPNQYNGPGNSQAYPPQKMIQEPVSSNSAPPHTQAPYYVSHLQGQQINAQQGPPLGGSMHIGAPPTSQSNLMNQMTNMTLGNQQRPPIDSGNLHPAAKSNALSPTPPSNVNGFSPSDHMPPSTAAGQKETNGRPPPPQGRSQGSPAPRAGLHSGHPGQHNQQGPPLPGTGQGPYSGHPGPGQHVHPDHPPEQMGLPSAPLPPMMQKSMTGPSQGQQNLSGPPLPGQHFAGSSMSGQHLPGPPLPGQNLSGPPLPGQNLSGPPLPGQNLSGPPGQNLSGPQGPQNMSGPPGPQNMSGPPLPGQNLGGVQFSGQSNISGPHVSGRTLPGQQSLSRPPLPGQQNMAGQHGQPFPSGPPVPGHPHLSPMSPSLPGAQMQGQKQYMSGPTLMNQPTSTSMGMNRQSPGAVPGYQQGGYQQQNYAPQPDVYGAQRSPYQGGVPGAPGYQSTMQSQQAKRLDPEQMPSPIQVMQDDQRTKGDVFVTNQKGLVPPLVTTKFVTEDRGNASPRYLRSTMYTVPTSADIIKQTSVPCGLVISPMARIEPGEMEPPIVDMGDIGPVRCIRCKAYMSPFMQFIDAGRRFQCLLCKATTEVPAEYFQHLDHTGQRMDLYERPELMLGAFEYIATKDYCRNNTFPKPPAIIFVIDVSYNTVKSGLVNLLCSEMKRIISHLPVDAGQTKTNMKVGFITYSNTVHFYNINPCLAQPQMMVVGDVQEVFMPLLDGFLCDAEESDAVIDNLMAQIPVMFADSRETETILAPAIQAGLEALKASECAGKLMVFHSSLPIADAPGKLKNRDDRKLLGTEKEKTVLAPQNNVYNNLGQDCVGSGCSVDLFIFNNSYVDIATIGQVCRLTGGEVYKYTYFQADVDGDRLITDIINNIRRPIAFDAFMRVRTSTGVRPTDFFGHFFMSNTTNMELASIDCDKAVAIEIKHDDKLTEDEGVYIQAALLYTSCGGVRRLRILNLSLRTSSQMAELYRACDLDAIINFFSKQSVFKLTESTPKTVKDSLIARCASILAAYRKHCASPSSVGQLILPECMKLLPLYVNCLLKSDALSGGADMTIDDRSYVMQAVATMPVSTSVAYIYPRLLPLHDIDPQDSGLPQMLRCSIDKFTDDGAYLLENGIHMFLWLGLNLSPQWVQDVFGVSSVVQVDTDRTSLPLLETSLNKRINEIVGQVRSQRHRCMRLTLVRQREKLEMVLRHFLVEDRGNDGSASYIDFLCYMHKEIRSLLS
ncbi:protein transport protein Sec24C isoform X2 [Orussus abietinus]|uniref:protein transport protein Sec24C isoform X2 n=1 Tax=Orussus abietinus TaxID=222816 RepID=UPI000625BC8A|nr:protein transport protein Sec24C isoform X2 [Orussus abietinus]